MTAAAPAFLCQELAAAVEQVQREVAAGAIVPRVEVSEIRRHLSSRYDFGTPLPLDEVVADVQEMLRSWQVQVTHPRYLGLFNPSVTTPSVIADTLTAIYNPQLASWRTSPGPNEIERHTLAWLSRKFGLPENTCANFTSGGAEANLSAVNLALTHKNPDYGQLGLRGVSAQPTIYISSQAHHSFHKIAHLTGLGRQAVRTVATDRDYRMDMNDLAARIADDRRNGLAPLMVIGTAGTTAAGAIDPLPGLADFCRRENLWFHVDAAWGGAAIISPALRCHLAGIDACDSLTCDAHKWFSVPMGAGMFLCRHRETVLRAFHADTSYMPPKSGESLNDPYTSSVQWSRRFTGLKLFLALAHYGEAGYIEMIERQARMGDLLRDSLRKSGWRIVNATPLPLVCFTRDGLDPTRLLASIYERQIAWLSAVHLGDAAPVLRACITSFHTTESDIQQIVSDITRLARQ